MKGSTVQNNTVSWIPQLISCTTYETRRAIDE